MTTSLIVPAGAGDGAPSVDQRLSLAAAAYLARFKGLSREHTNSDLRAYLVWCAGRDIEPLGAQRQHLELYMRWMQERSTLTNRRNDANRDSNEDDCGGCLYRSSG